MTMSNEIITAQTALDAANAAYAPIAKALHGYRFNLSMSKAANAKAKAELATAEAKAARTVRAAAHALLTAKKGV